MDIKKEVLKYNTRDGVEPNLSSFFRNQFSKLIEIGAYTHKTEALKDSIVKDLAEYKEQYNLSNIVLGMRGGIDSDLTAS